jgi:hypothetical protein
VSEEPSKGTYAGLFAIALATLAYEILLTRIFSVTLYYHFAFVAISVAMFGMTVGAVLVYQARGFFSAARTRTHMALGSLLFGAAGIASFAAHVAIPSFTRVAAGGFGSLVPTYVVMAIPFVFSGVTVCLALTRYPARVGRLYAADLARAALGGAALVGALKIVDGPTAVILVGLLGAIAAVLFARDGGNAGLVRLGAVAAILFALLAGTNGFLRIEGRTPWLRLFHVRGAPDTPYLYEAWNSFSRVTALELGKSGEIPSGWGLSSALPTKRSGHEMELRIDGAAATRMTAYGGDPNAIEHLKYDIVNTAHFLREDADVLAIGVGGGRDVLSALAFRQRSVVGVEINENVLRAMNDRFGEFTGHLDRDPRVTLVVDEARSWVARQARRFDIIQISLIDTWAATAAGAFVFAENSLYTVEAWKIFLDHLAPNGILTVTRWYFGDRPSEIYRASVLACEALRRMGVDDPRGHILILRKMLKRGRAGPSPDGVGTILVSPGKFSESDLRSFENVVSVMKYEKVLTPAFAIDDVFPRIVAREGRDAFLAAYPLDLSAPTDDGPFFFHMIRLRDVLDPARRGILEQGINQIQLSAVTVLATLLAVVTALTLACIIVPLLLTTRKGALRGSAPLFVYFAAIGFGFMLVEVSQMQRLVVFLGHPTYALSVVLFSLLVSSGLGSLAASRIDPARGGRRALVLPSGLLLALFLFGVATPRVASLFEGSPTPVRIAIAAAILFGIGLFMGTAFPIGMRLASSRSPELTPWLWGVNGATSVCASVLAMVIALALGISAAFWTGVACYAVATLAMLWVNGKGPAGAQPTREGSFA